MRRTSPPRLLLLLLVPPCVAIAGPAPAQEFAPAQSRAADLPARPGRVGAGETGFGAPGGGGTSLLSTGMPVPEPLGMAGGDPNSGVISARVPTAGALVTLPPSAVANGTRLYTYTNALGGLESVAYDPGTGATVVYDQTITYSLQDRSARFGQVPQAGPSSASGLANNPSFSLQPGRAIPDVGIPAINQASPSYDYRTNLGLGPSPSGSPASPFSGTPMGTLGGAPATGTVASPFSGTPMGTLGGGGGGGTGTVASPFSGTPMGTLGGSP